MVHHLNPYAYCLPFFSTFLPKRGYQEAKISQKLLKFGHAAQVIGSRLAVYGQNIIKIKIFRKKYITSGKTNFGLNMMFTGRYRTHHLQNVVKNTVFEAKISQKWLKFGHAAQVIGRRLVVYGKKIIKIKIFQKKI